MKLEGVYTALVTPIVDGRVDTDGLRRNVQFQIEQGVSGLLPLGTTGETPTLSREERDAVLSAVVEEVAGKLPVIAGTGTNSTTSTIEETKRAKDLGADAVLIVTPYYNKPTQSGILRHYEAVTSAVEIPVVQYNIKGRSAVNVETPTMMELARNPLIVGVKEASGDISQISDVIGQISTVRDDFAVLSGDDEMTFPIMAFGGRGVIAVGSNVVPAAFVSLVSKMLAGDLEAARLEHYRLKPFFRACFVETNPVPIKYAMSLLGMAAGEVRGPLAPLEPESEKVVRRAIENLGLLS